MKGRTQWKTMNKSSQSEQRSNGDCHGAYETCRVLSPWYGAAQLESSTGW